MPIPSEGASYTLNRNCF